MDVYPLISEKMDHPLSLIRRMRLKMHLSICNLCHIYSKQLQTLRNLARNLGKEDSQAIEKKTLNPETKEKIQKYIKENN
jgi:hypothetical protein